MGAQATWSIWKKMEIYATLTIRNQKYQKIMIFFITVFKITKKSEPIKEVLLINNTQVILHCGKKNVWITHFQKFDISKNTWVIDEKWKSLILKFSSISL